MAHRIQKRHLSSRLLTSGQNTHWNVRSSSTSGSDGYRQTGSKNGQLRSTFVEATVLVPKGIVCLVSALQFHTLTLQMLSAVWMEIERTAWRPTISYPPIRFVRFSGWAMTEGVERHPIQSHEVSITQWKGCVKAFNSVNARGINSDNMRRWREFRQLCAPTSRRWSPMPREVRNFGASVRTRLLARSRAENANYQILLTRYALEDCSTGISVSSDRW